MGDVVPMKPPIPSKKKDAEHNERIIRRIVGMPLQKDYGSVDPRNPNNKNGAE